MTNTLEVIDDSTTGITEITNTKDESKNNVDYELVKIDDNKQDHDNGLVECTYNNNQLECDECNCSCCAIDCNECSCSSCVKGCCACTGYAFLKMIDMLCCLTSLLMVIK